VRDGLAQANAFSSRICAEPSDCGLAITVIPGARADKHSTNDAQQVPAAKVDDSPVKVSERVHLDEPGPDEQPYPVIDGNSQTGYDERPPIKVSRVTFKDGNPVEVIEAHAADPSKEDVAKVKTTKPKAAPKPRTPKAK
jgi:hypothetical protein